MTGEFILSELLSVANPEKAKFLQGFFKTGKGQYAEGDVMLGIVVPIIRNIVKVNKSLPFPEIQKLLDSEYHEARLSGLLFLVQQFKKSKKEEEKKEIYEFYLKNARRANNWDLVDVTCRDVVGTYLLDKDRTVLYELAESDNLWEQRIAIVSTWMFIKHRQFDDTLALSVKLMEHKHDLMHKAIGWMLREVGKKNRETLTDFLEMYATKLPRTSLRYAIEHYPDDQRQYFLKKK
jgi:Predicted DNA alkylation repair enzyme